jgi:DivIVA domain-containing protein
LRPPPWEVAGSSRQAASPVAPPIPEPPDIWPQTAEQVRSKTFPDARRGYDPEQVRAYLAQVADVLGRSDRRRSHRTGYEDRSRVGSDQIRRRRFATVRRGFDAPSVDSYLEKLAAQVEALELSTEP